MYNAHKHLQCNQEAFDTILELLLKAMMEHGVMDKKLLSEIKDLVVPLA